MASTRMEQGPRTPAADPAPRGQALTGRQWIALCVMLTGVVMTVMDVFIVNVAVPSIVRTLGASFAQVQWILAGYALVYAVGLVTAGRLGDIHGRRRMFMIGLACFTAASVLCGLAPGARALVAARLLQGLAAAALSPQVLSLLRVAYGDPRQRATAFAALGVSLGLACIAGQLVGGVLISADLWGLAWRPVFLLNLPLGLAALCAAPFFVAESRSAAAPRADFTGMALSGTGLGLLLYPLVHGRESGWTAVDAGMLAAALPALWGFVVHQRARAAAGRSPLVDMGLFRVPSFTLGLCIVLLLYSTFNVTYLAFALLVQTGLGDTPLQAGLVLACNAFAFMVASVAARHLALRWRYALLRYGAAIAAIACLMGAGIARWDDALSPSALVPFLLVWGIGQGLLMTPLLDAILGGVGESHAGAAAGVLSTVQQVGGALGVALVGMAFDAVLDRSKGMGADAAHAYAHAFAAAALYAALANLAIGIMLQRLAALNRPAAADAGPTIRAGAGQA